MPVTNGLLITAGLLISAGAVLADAFWIEQFFIKINQFYVGAATKKTRNIKVVQVSDLHLNKLSYQLKRLTKRINKTRPDLIVFTGDMIDKAANLFLLNDFLQRIDKDIQKTAILGNWEYQSKADLSKLFEIYLHNNCKLLINQSIQYSFPHTTVAITGIDDYIAGNADIDAAVTEYKKSDHHIILCHCPKYTDQVSARISKEINVDFILSGHTHGGQITLFGKAPHLPRGSGRYIKGWYNDRIPKLYVSKGIGTVFIPVRFCARAEIAVFHLAI